MGRTLDHAGYFPRGYLHGLTLSTAGSSATFGIAIGQAVDSTFIDLMTLASAYTKTTSAWALGTAAGSLDTGSIAASTWYHVYLIKRADTGVVDVLVSLSATAPTMPTNYTLFRRIGSMKTNASSQWTLFIQVGDKFLWSVTVADSTTVATAAAALVTLSVPTNVQVDALIRVTATGPSATSWSLILTSPDESDQATSFPLASMVGPNITGFPTSQAGEFNIRTDTSARIRQRGSATLALTDINTCGWVDTRGKLS